jgi:drug/metabolite transporter (DMT)-like permease
VWGTTWFAIKISLEGLPPFLGASFRFSLALFLLFSYLLVNKISIRLQKKHFRLISLSAFLMYALDYGLIYWGEQYLSAGVTAIFFATFPLFTGIWATFLFKSEVFHFNKFAGLLLGLAGITLVFLDQLLITQFDLQVILGGLAIIIGAAAGAMSVVLIKKYLSGLNPVVLSFHQMLQGVIFLFFFGILLEHDRTLNFSPRIISAVVYLGILGSAIAFALYYWLLQNWSAITLSLIIYITPLIALIVDYFMFGEVIHLRAIIGMTIIFSGIAVVQLDLRGLQRFRGKIVQLFQKKTE